MGGTVTIFAERWELDPFLGKIHIVSGVIKAGETYGGSAVFPKGALMSYSAGKYIEFVAASNDAYGLLFKEVKMRDDGLDTDCEIIDSCTALDKSKVPNWHVNALSDPIGANIHITPLTS